MRTPPLISLGDIHLGGPTAADYTVFLAGAPTATITTRPVTADSQTKVFGTTDPTLTFAPTNGALAGGDGPSGALSRQPGEDVGSYAIGQGTLTLSANYALTFVGADLTVTPATPVVTVTDAAGDYNGSAYPAAASVTGAGGAGWFNRLHVVDWPILPRVRRPRYQILHRRRFSIETGPPRVDVQGWVRRNPFPHYVRPEHADATMRAVPNPVPTLSRQPQEQPNRLLAACAARDQIDAEDEERIHARIVWILLGQWTGLDRESF